MRPTPNRDILDLRHDVERTIVLIPSISFSRLTSTYLIGRNFFEERNLFYLACLANPGTRFVAVVSDIIEPCYVDYCIEHARAAYDLDAEDVRRRFEIVRVPHSGDESLSAALNAQPDQLTALRATLAGYPAPILDFWLVSSNLCTTRR